MKPVSRFKVMIKFGHLELGKIEFVLYTTG